ncbi:MAG: hypothetical protein KDI44_10045 [Thiothrix sp.]|nr:hypothetical protein [Thiothrix sp.]HPQ95571.1 S41 family peptidase [Thiolinea sp.]
MPTPESFAAEMPLLQDVLPDNTGLTLRDKQVLVNQASVLIGQVYAHLPLKKALYGIDPVQRLELMKYRLENPRDELVNSEIEFHRELLNIFHSLHDLHTNYVLPVPYRRLTAILPFLVEEYFDDRQQSHYLVTKMPTGFQHAHFKPGVEILLWNGLPIREAIRRNGENESGSNSAARFAVGLRSLTIRPLSISLPPEEVHVFLEYQDEQGVKHEIRFEWLTLQAGGRTTAESGTGIATPASAADSSIMLDIWPDARTLYQQSLMGQHLQAQQINACRKLLYAAAEPPPPAFKNLLETSQPELIRAGVLDTPDGEYGYLRLYSFMVDDLSGYLDEVKKLLQQLPSEGLVLDVRGNAGGLITAAEGLLQLLTPHPIEPEKAQFISTPLIRELCRRNSPSPLVPRINFSEWLPSLTQAQVSGALYSTAHSLTSHTEANAIGQVYTGPVVLITDAYCYSATDMLAAGFRDHRIGSILGASDNTGAGGANVWQHMLLRILAQVPGMEESGLLQDTFKELPRFADFRVSSRRMLRVGTQSGLPLEDFGVEPDKRHYMSRRDVLEGNTDLFQHAAKLLSQQPVHRLEASFDAQSCEVHLKTTNIDRLDWFINQRAAGSIDVTGTEASIKPAVMHEESRLVILAYQDGELVAHARLNLQCA